MKFVSQNGLKKKAKELRTGDSRKWGYTHNPSNAMKLA
jgi:hypothetical protein